LADLSAFTMQTVGVLQVFCDPVEPLPDMRRVDGASRYIDAPAGVVFSFQISPDSVEPTIASRSCNLLTHDDRGPDGGDKAMEVRPQVPWISLAEASAGGGERLARTRARPDWAVVGPSCEPKGVAPSADTGEEMALGELSKVIRSNIDN
jgi:hypothetical protein